MEFFLKEESHSTNCFKFFCFIVSDKEPQMSTALWTPDGANQISARVSPNGTCRYVTNILQGIHRFTVFRSVKGTWRIVTNVTTDAV